MKVQNSKLYDVFASSGNWQNIALLFKDKLKQLADFG